MFDTISSALFWKGPKKNTVRERESDNWLWTRNAIFLLQTLPPKSECKFNDMLDYILQYCSCKVGKISPQKFEEILVCFNTVVVLFSNREFVCEWMTLIVQKSTANGAREKWRKISNVWRKKKITELLPKTTRTTKIQLEEWQLLFD